jgi:hypothetical protein
MSKIRRCEHPGCRTLTTGSRCEKHADVDMESLSEDIDRATLLLEVLQEATKRADADLRREQLTALKVPAPAEEPEDFIAPVP